MQEAGYNEDQIIKKTQETMNSVTKFEIFIFLPKFYTFIHVKKKNVPYGIGLGSHLCKILSTFIKILQLRYYQYK